MFTNGNWSPDQNNQSAQQAPQMKQQNPNMSNSNMQPAQMSSSPPQYQAAQPQYQKVAQPAQAYGPPAPAQQQYKPSYQLGNQMQLSNQNQPYQPQQSYGQGPQQAPQGYYQSYQQPAPQSAMQSVNNNNPQSVQNFLQALHQNPSMGSSNGWANPQGVHGLGPQAGFQGFNQNGNPYAQGNNWQSYGQGYQPQLGSYGNQAQGGGGATMSAGTAPMNGVSNNIPQFTNTAPVAPPELTYEQLMAKVQQETAQIQQNLRAYSDVNTKQNIESGDDQLNDFLSHLNAYSYEYKDPKFGEGRRIAPMAQEIEKSDLGKAAISLSDEGYKIVDYGKLGGTMLAAQAMEHKRVNAHDQALALLNHKYSELEKQLKSSIMAALKEKGKR